MTIRKMLDLLKYMSQDATVRDMDGDYLCYEFGSDRGYYDYMYVGVFEEGSTSPRILTVGNLIELLYKALNVGEMHGYKGGLFNITEDTVVTLGGWGYIGNEIVDLDCDNLVCVIAYK